MYSAGHQQGHSSRLNGATGNRGGMPMIFNNYSNNAGHQHQQHTQHHQNLQDHTGIGGGGGGNGTGLGHHSSYSNGILPAPSSPYPAQNLPNGHSGNTRGGQAQQISESWAQQLKSHDETKRANATMMEGATSHYYARLKASDNKGLAPTQVSLANGSQGMAALQTIEPVDDEHGARRPWRVDAYPQKWHNLDMSGVGLQSLSSAVFRYTFLSELYIASNRITALPPTIGQLRQLTILEVSNNLLTELPPELGMCTYLKELRLFNNKIRQLPDELGSLHNLEILGIEGNRELHEDIRNEMMTKGTKSLITKLRENAQKPEPPLDRVIVPVNEDAPANWERVKVLSWNILCEKYATTQAYGYTPIAALAWIYRKESIISDIRVQDADVVCLQEVSNDAMREVLNPELAKQGYKGIQFPRSKAKVMAEREANAVDGCAVFWKASKYILLDKQVVDFATIAINRPDMKNHHDIFNRVMPKDNIGMICFFESRYTGARMIVVNAHLAWEPIFADVKLIQTAILMDHVGKWAEKYVRWPACRDKRYFQMPSEDGTDQPLPEPAPSQTYRNSTDIPLMISGDFNSTKDSSVYQLLSTGRVPPDHPDFGKRSYGIFTRDGIDHAFSLRSSYQALVSTADELVFTNYTPGFIGHIDYIWYSTNSLEVLSLLGPPDMQYLQKVPGFPHYHFPADHIQIMAEFAIKAKKEKKAPADGSLPKPDFGSMSSDRRH